MGTVNKSWRYHGGYYGVLVMSVLDPQKQLAGFQDWSAPVKLKTELPWNDTHFQSPELVQTPQSSRAEHKDCILFPFPKVCVWALPSIREGCNFPSPSLVQAACALVAIQVCHQLFSAHCHQAMFLHRAISLKTVSGSSSSRPSIGEGFSMAVPEKWAWVGF